MGDMKRSLRAGSRRGVMLMMDYDARIAELEERVDSLERTAIIFRETVFTESVEALTKRIDSLHESVDALYETMDKLQRRVEYHSEWCQNLQEMISSQHRITRQ